MYTLRAFLLSFSFLLQSAHASIHTVHCDEKKFFLPDGKPGIAILDKQIPHDVDIEFEVTLRDNPQHTFLNVYEIIGEGDYGMAPVLNWTTNFHERITIINNNVGVPLKVIPLPGPLKIDIGINGLSYTMSHNNHIVAAYRLQNDVKIHRIELKGDFVVNTTLVHCKQKTNGANEDWWYTDYEDADYSDEDVEYFNSMDLDEWMPKTEPENNAAILHDVAGDDQPDFEVSNETSIEIASSSHLTTNLESEQKAEDSDVDDIIEDRNFSQKQVTYFVRRKRSEVLKSIEVIKPKPILKESDEPEVVESGFDFASSELVKKLENAPESNDKIREHKISTEVRVESSSVLDSDDDVRRSRSSEEDFPKSEVLSISDSNVVHAEDGDDRIQEQNALQTDEEIVSTALLGNNMNDEKFTDVVHASEIDDTTQEQTLSSESSATLLEGSGSDVIHAEDGDDTIQEQKLQTDKEIVSTTYLEKILSDSDKTSSEATTTNIVHADDDEDEIREQKVSEKENVDSSLEITSAEESLGSIKIHNAAGDDNIQEQTQLQTDDEIVSATFLEDVLKGSGKENLTSSEDGFPIFEEIQTSDLSHAKDGDDKIQEQKVSKTDKAIVSTEFFDKVLQDSAKPNVSTTPTGASNDIVAKIHFLESEEGDIIKFFPEQILNESEKVYSSEGDDKLVEREESTISTSEINPKILQDDITQRKREFEFSEDGFLITKALQKSNVVHASEGDDNIEEQKRLKTERKVVPATFLEDVLKDSVTTSSKTSEDGFPVFKDLQTSDVVHAVDGDDYMQKQKRFKTEKEIVSSSFLEEVLDTTKPRVSKTSSESSEDEFPVFKSLPVLRDNIIHDTSGDDKIQEQKALKTEKKVVSTTFLKDILGDVVDSTVNKKQSEEAVNKSKSNEVANRNIEKLSVSDFFGKLSASKIDLTRAELIHDASGDDITRESLNDDVEDFIEGVVHNIIRRESEVLGGESHLKLESSKLELKSSLAEILKAGTSLLTNPLFALLLEKVQVNVDFKVDIHADKLVIGAEENGNRCKT